MIGAERLIFIGCLLQGALCWPWKTLPSWSTFMPTSIEALSGSCVLIPCRFEIPSEYEHDLKNPAGIWRRDGLTDGNTVFNSSRTDNIIQGNITGNLLQKNCTTVLNNILSKWSGDYYFRIECNSKLKYNFPKQVKVEVKDSPGDPKVTVNTDTVKEGDSVTLTCSAPAPCPSLPPSLSWTPRLNDSITVLQENNDQALYVSSVMKFTASHRHHNWKFKCTAVYRLQKDCSAKKSNRSLTLNVQYSPKNTSIIIGRDFSLTCSSDANPAVKNYTWYKASGSEIKAVSYTQSLPCNITVADRGQYYCQAQNELGLENSSALQLHTVYSSVNPQVTVNRDTVKEGDSVTLTCSAPAPCPSLPPTLLWTPELNDSITVLQENDDQSLDVSSVMTFTASHLHEQEFKCTAVYRLQEDSSERSSHTNFTLKVQHTPPVCCKAVDYFKSPPILIAAAVGAAGMMLLCILMQIVLRIGCTRQNHVAKLQETEDLTPTDQELSENDNSILHYASISHGTESEQGRGAIRGGCQHTEYAEVKHNTGNELEDVTAEDQDEEATYAEVLGVSLEDSGTKKNTKQPKDQHSALTEQLCRSEPNEEATYGNICHQVKRKEPNKSPATAGAPGNKEQRAAAEGR